MSTNIDNQATAFSTRKLLSDALDYAVGLALNLEPIHQDQQILVSEVALSAIFFIPEPREGHYVRFAPSTDFTQGGELFNHFGGDVRQYKKRPYSIIHPRHFDASKGDEIRPYGDSGREMCYRPNTFGELQGKWLAKSTSDSSMISWNIKYDIVAPTFLVAAMRLLVLERLGEHVELPESVQP